MLLCSLGCPPAGPGSVPWGPGGCPRTLLVVLDPWGQEVQTAEVRRELTAHGELRGHIVGCKGAPPAL